MHQQNPPVLNWRCRKTQVDLYSGRITAGWLSRQKWFCWIDVSNLSIRTELSSCFQLQVYWSTYRSDKDKNRCTAQHMVVSHMEQPCNRLHSEQLLKYVLLYCSQCIKAHKNYNCDSGLLIDLFTNKHIIF